MKNKSVLALALIFGLSMSQKVNCAEIETTIYDKKGIVLKLNVEKDGIFKVSIENKSNKDMLNVKLKSDDIKGLKLVKGREIEIGNVKAFEKKILEEKELKYEIDKEILNSIKSGKLSKTGIDGVYKLYVPIAILGLTGLICVLVSKKRNSKKLLSVAIGTGILASSIFSYVTNAEVLYQYSVDVGGKITVGGKLYDYTGVLMWNYTDNTTNNNTDNNNNNTDNNNNNTDNNIDNNNNNTDNNSSEDTENKDKVIKFTDKNLENIILKKLHAYDGNDEFDGDMNEFNFKITDSSYRKSKDSNEIFKSDLEKIESLAIRGYDEDFNPIEIKSLDGLEYCSNLKTFTISSGEIPADDSEIRYSEGAIKDLKPLSKLKKLELLRLSHNEISDVSPLKDLNNLKSLYISHNNISDISSLKNLVNLENFDFAVNKVFDINVVKNFKNLKLLDLYSNKVSDISAVKDLKNLTYLRADSNKISDVSCLENLKNLENLNLGSNKLLNTDVINTLTNLKILDLKNNALNEIKLNNLVKLNELNISKNRIKDISTLKDLLNLNKLYIQNNEIKNIDSISKLLNLKILNFSNNIVENADSLKNLNNLETLKFSYNKISDISFIKDFSKLGDIDLSNNMIKDFTCLNNLKSLYSKILNNQIINIDDINVKEKVFEIDSPFIGIEKIAKNGNVNVESDNKEISINYENGKLKFNLSDEIFTKLKNEDIKLNIKFNFENENDFSKPSNSFSINDVTLKCSKSENYVDIKDPLFLKLINKNIDINRKDDEKVSIEDMEKLKKIDVEYKDESGKNVQILPLSKDLKGTKDFKFAVSRELKSIEGIKYAKNLEYLDLSESEISDISELSELSKLEFVELDRNRIVDLKPLSNLKNLKHLKLYNNLIEDVTPLKDLTELTYLDIHFNVTAEGNETNAIYSKGITNIEPLANLKKLKLLDVSANRIENIKILSEFKNIEDLDLSGNMISDYSGLEDYLFERLLRMYDENNPSGSVNFWAQNVNFGKELVVEDDTLEFDNPFKGIKELSGKFAKHYGTDGYSLFSFINTNVDGITAQHDINTDKIKIVVDKKVASENAGKTINLNLNLSNGEGLEWNLKNVKLKFEKKKIVSKEYEDFYYNLFNKWSKFYKKYEYLTDEANAKFNETNKPKKDKNFTKEDFEMLKSIKITDQNITDDILSPLKYAKNLEEIQILLKDKQYRRLATDFSFLKNIPNLKIFYYSNQDPSVKEKDNIGQIDFSNNKNLKDVRISKTNLSNLEFLKNLNLETLSLQDNEIENISPILNMSNLKRLDLDNNKISNILDMSNFKKLNTLYLLGNPISDISNLGNLTNLEALHLRNTKISDISSLVNLQKLHRLYIDRNNNLENYMDNLKEIKSINTLFVDKISKEDFEWMKEFSIREAIDSTEKEDSIRIFHFEKLEIPIEINESDIKDEFIEIENPLKDWADEYVLESELDSDGNEIKKNENLIFGQDKIKIKVINRTEFEENYEIYLENYDSVYGEYGQPASISGKVVLKVKIS